MSGKGEFDAEWLFAFRKIVGKQDEAAIGALHQRLKEIGARYRHVIETIPSDLPGAPFNKTLTQRISWLESNVISPAERLVAALSDKQGPMFSTWPYEHEFLKPLDGAVLRGRLLEFLEFAQRLRRNLAGERDADAGTNQELRAMIYYDIDEAMKSHLPGIKPSRGSYDFELKIYVGIFPDAMRHIYHEITGTNEQIARLIAAFID